MLSLIHEAKQITGVTRSEFMRQALTEKLEKLSIIETGPRKRIRNLVSPRDHFPKEN
jgi:hypothetical protein